MPESQPHNVAIIDAFQRQVSPDGYSTAILKPEGHSPIILPIAVSETHERSVSNIRQQLEHWITLLDYLTLGTNSAMTRITLSRGATSPKGQTLVPEEESIYESMTSLNREIGNMSVKLQIEAISVGVIALTLGAIADVALPMTPPFSELGTAAAATLFIMARNAGTIITLSSTQKINRYIQHGLYPSETDRVTVDATTAEITNLLNEGNIEEAVSLARNTYENSQAAEIIEAHYADPETFKERAQVAGAIFKADLFALMQKSKESFKKLFRLDS